VILPVEDLASGVYVPDSGAASEFIKSRVELLVRFFALFIKLVKQDGCLSQLISLVGVPRADKKQRTNCYIDQDTRVEQYADAHTHESKHYNKWKHPSQLTLLI